LGLLLLIIALAGAPQAGVSPEAVLDLEAAIVGRRSKIFENYYKNTIVLKLNDGTVVHRWAESTGGPGMSRDGYNSPGSWRWCIVYASIDNGLITKVRATGNKRVCTHMFAVMKSLK
jgi:hypothetical protein